MSEFNLKKQGFEILIKQDNTFYTFLFSFLGLILSVLVNVPILMTISSILLFSSFDSLGYYYILTRYQSSTPENYYEFAAAYRTIQTIFQIFIFIFMGFFSLPAAIGFLLLWWFGVCDMLYYILLKQDFILYDNMFWLNWSIIKLFTKKITGNYLYKFSIFSILFILFLVFYFTKFNPIYWNFLTLINEVHNVK